jgi:hypothetical protein
MLLLMLGIAAAVFRDAWRSGWALGIYAALLHSLVDFPMQIPAIAGLLVTLLAALCAEDKECRLERRHGRPEARSTSAGRG